MTNKIFVFQIPTLASHGRKNEKESCRKILENKRNCLLPPIMTLQYNKSQPLRIMICKTCQNMSRHVLHCSLYADFISFLALDIVSLEKDDPV